MENQLPRPLAEYSAADLQRRVISAREALSEIHDTVLNDSQIQRTIWELMRASDLLAEFAQLCDKDADEANRILAAAIASLANGCTVREIADELRRRAEEN